MRIFTVGAFVFVLMFIRRSVWLVVWFLLAWIFFSPWSAFKAALVFQSVICLFFTIVLLRSVLAEQEEFTKEPLGAAHFILTEILERTQRGVPEAVACYEAIAVLKESDEFLATEMKTDFDSARTKKVKPGELTQISGHVFVQLKVELEKRDPNAASKAGEKPFHEIAMNIHNQIPVMYAEMTKATPAG